MRSVLDFNPFVLDLELVLSFRASVLLLVKLLIAVSEVSTAPYHPSGDRREGRREGKGEEKWGTIKVLRKQTPFTAPPLTTSLFPSLSLSVCV